MATFDEAALSKLTAKIDSRLAESKKGDQSKGKRKLEETVESVQPPAKKRNNTPKPNGKQPPKQNDKQSPKENGRQAPKQNGKQPPKQNGKPSPKQAQTKPVKQSKSKTASAREPPSLLDEIRALGGDEADFKLVEDANSDDENIAEQKGKKNNDKELQAELARFAAGLGFDSVHPDSASEEELNADEDEEGEEGSDDEAEADEDGSGESSAGSDHDADDKLRDPKRKTIFEPRPDWHAVNLKSLPAPSSDDVAPYTAAIANLKAHASTLLEQDTASYSSTYSATSSRKFMSTIMSSGTMSDKVSALTLAIQESPVHSIKPLENLMGLGGKRSRGQALSALAALVDLLGPGMILPSDRRLRLFSSQPGLIGTLQKHSVKSWSAGQALPGKITQEHLISWLFEDWLKDAYFKMIQNLEIWCDDEVEYARTKAVDLVFALLRDKPEQESNLLRLIVNKLGDRERKISSRASYLLLQLLNTHPGMKAIVVRSIEQDVIFRPGQNIRAKYYAINTLNQTILSTKEPEIADSLLTIYFGVFVALLKSGQLSEVDGPPEAASKTDKDKARQKRKPGKGKEERPQGVSSEQESAEKLVSAILTGINRAVPFSQSDQSTLESHLDTLFRITHSSNFNTSIQALMLIQQLSATRHLATERFFRTLYESLLDPRLVTSSKQALYLNLMYRSLKSDVDVRRVKAFVKRMLQILNLHQPSFVCGILYLIIQLCGTFPDLKTLLEQPEEHDDIEEGGAQVATDAPAGNATDELESKHSARNSTYDGRKRDPEYSNAHLSCLWEIVPFLKHFHPSVDVYASGLLNGKKVSQKPELANHTLIAFLDKFVYRNAKAVDSKGISIMQPVAASGQGSILLSSKPSSKTVGSSLNSAAFWDKKSEDVAVDDVFFHEYFSQIGKPGQADRQKKAKKASEDAEEEEENEDEIWEALVSSRPEVQEDSDDDVDFDDLMSLDESEDEQDKDGPELDEDQEASEDDELDFLGDSDFGSGDDDDEEGPSLQALPKDEKEKDKKPEDERKARRKALRNLPTFASADDYAEMLAQDEDDL
ncbi:CBF-domain-containing protein [Xylariomycetidae sp. FL2044]|nr:CBF-domain-containing protein [Xylariomycetidae sp. FL2044]